MTEPIISPSQLFNIQGKWNKLAAVKKTVENTNNNHSFLFLAILHHFFLFITYYIIFFYWTRKDGFVNCCYYALKPVLKHFQIIKNNNFDAKHLCFVNTTFFWGGGEKWHYNTASYLSNNHTIYFIADKNGAIWTKANNTKIILKHGKSKGLSFLNPFKIYSFKRYFIHNNIKGIVVNNPADLKLFGLAAYLAGVDNIIYRRGIAVKTKFNFLNHYLLNAVCTHIIANTNETFKLLTSNFQPINQVNHTILHNGIRIPKTNKEPKYNHPIILGNAGRLVEQKGQKLLLDIIKILNNKKIDFRLKIAGSGPLENELKQYAKKVGVGDKVDFLGFVEDMDSFMEQIDIFLLTSKWEGFGYVIAEAMCYKKPVVAFNVSSNIEVIKSNITGFLIPPYNLEMFANNIINLINNEDLRISMGEKARERVETKFNLDKQNFEFEKLIYNNLFTTKL